uniref:Uncharacterized protein n=1 Tax=Rhipicephalus zambeziensis TaxID=60191 RepID=A0A224YL02_9ACAR
MPTASTVPTQPLTLLKLLQLMMIKCVRELCNEWAPLKHPLVAKFTHSDAWRDSMLMPHNIHALRRLLPLHDIHVVFSSSSFMQYCGFVVEHLLATQMAWVRFSLEPKILMNYFICIFPDFSVTDSMTFHSQPKTPTTTPTLTQTSSLMLSR